MPMAQVPKFDPRLLATIPTMIPTIPKRKGIMNNDKMEMINAMTPIAFPLDATPLNHYPLQAHHFYMT